MGRFTFADEDSPSGSRAKGRAARDLEFLQWLKTASGPMLEAAMLDKRLPKWRRVALQRALAKQGKVST